LVLIDLWWSGFKHLTGFDQEARDLPKAFGCTLSLSPQFSFFQRLLFLPMLALPKGVLKGSTEDCADHDADQSYDDWFHASLGSPLIEPIEQTL
jgi:hypothetical protein